MKVFLFSTLLFAVAATLPLVASAEERTWTSSDGSRTFEGRLRSFDPGSGTVSVVTSEGRLLEFTAEKLSEGDREFLQNWKPSSADSPAAGPDTESEVGGKVAKARLHRIDGERYRRAELEKTPEFYLFYFSASW